MKLSREAKIGIVATLALALFIWGLNFLKGKNILSSNNAFYIQYDNVEGLKESATVTLHGIKIGLVTTIDFGKQSADNVLVEITVEQKVDIPADSRAQLYNSDLLGTKAIKILPGESAQFLSNNDTLQSDYQEGLTDKMDDLVISIEGIINNADSVTTAMAGLFDHQTSKQLQQTIQNLSATSRNMDHITAVDGDLNQTIHHLHTVTENIAQHNNTISSILNNIETVSDSLTRVKLAGSVDSAILAINEARKLLYNINEGQGTLGQLAQNDSLYHHISNTTENLDILLRDLKDHPKRYVHFSLFGKKDK